MTFTKSTAPVYRRTGERYTGVDLDRWRALRPDETVVIQHRDGSPELRGTWAELEQARRRDIEATLHAPKMACWALPDPRLMRLL